MPKVLYLTTSADARDVRHAGRVYSVSAKEAAELTKGGFAREISASEEEALAPSGRATGRRGASQAVSGPDEEE